MATNENTESAERWHKTTPLRQSITIDIKTHTHQGTSRYQKNKIKNKSNIVFFLSTPHTFWRKTLQHTLSIALRAKQINVRGSILPSCLTSVWLVLQQSWSCHHDGSPRRDGGGAPSLDPSRGRSRLPPLPAVCPSPSEPTAVETEPATHSLPWPPVGYTSQHHSATARHLFSLSKMMDEITRSNLLLAFSFFLQSNIQISLFWINNLSPPFNYISLSSLLPPQWDSLQEPTSCNKLLYILAISLSLSLSEAPSLYCSLSLSLSRAHPPLDPSSFSLFNTPALY